jgi:glycosyltransferase involved in cell wall biosynthesis
VRRYQKRGGALFFKVMIVNEQPLVSIVIPAFNARYFADALNSALDQTYANLEILVGDDSGSDAIEALVKEASVRLPGRLHYQRNPRRLGFAGNVLALLERAQGEAVKVLCDDDRLLARCVEHQAALFQRAEIKLALAQRVFCDAGDFTLPARLQNVTYVNSDSIFKGTDILAFLAANAVNFLGNFSAAMFRRAEAIEILRVLVGEGQQFEALLDLALFVCLMRHGEVGVLRSAAIIERLHPERLSQQDAIKVSAAQEWRWLAQMLGARGGESPPAVGWVRFVELHNADEVPRRWQELCLLRTLATWQCRLNGRIGSASESYETFYQQWLEDRRFSDAQKRFRGDTIAAWPARPRIAVIVRGVTGVQNDIEATLGSLDRQLYPASHVVVVGGQALADRSGLSWLKSVDGWVQQLNEIIVGLEAVDWVYLLQAGDQLSESALMVLAERAALQPALGCIYSDEGSLKDGKSCEPVFKPDFNLDLYRSYPYLGRTLAFNREVILTLGGFDADFSALFAHDMVWRVVESVGLQAVEHIAEIQVQLRCDLAQWLSGEQVVEESAQVVSAHLSRLGIAHHIRHDDMKLLNRVDYLHGQRPLVSIIICVDSRQSALQACIENLLQHTRYERYEIIIVHDDLVAADIRTWLDEMSGLSAMLRVLPLEGECSIARMLNHATQTSQGEFLVLLGCGYLVREEYWLDELLNHAFRGEVAVVGGKLFDNQGKVGNAGMVLGVGRGAQAAFAGESAQARGYLQRLQVVQNWSALSRDCMMVRREVLNELQGFDEQNYAEGLEDIDLCLRAAQQGYLMVWTPYAQLQQATGQVVGAPLSKHSHERREKEYYQFCDRWLSKIIRDPAYNANLSLLSADFSLSHTLRGSWNPLLSRAVPSVLGLPINDSAIGHYRVTEPLLQLEAAGRITGYYSYESPTTAQLARMNPDVVILQLRHNQESVQDIERIARFSNARRIFEIDDYVLSTPKKNTHARNKPADIEHHLRKGISLCDRVVVTTDALANALEGMHHDIRVVPNMLTPRMWRDLPVSRRGTSSRPRVGWGGGTSHLGDLEIIAEVVRELAGEVEWVFFGMCPEALKPYIHEYHPGVSLQAYPAKLASLNLDLALAPLEFHIFNDCKSNLRLLEYGACGYPTICTDTEAYRGTLPCTRVYSNSTQEWLQAIRTHLSDPVASYRMGDELREAVMRDFVLREDNVQHWEWGWLAD